ncbi:MAG: FprA family A-type flavoprotein [Candidatus Zophobacter franzmannii]|nr:FprA family A-type flavoprotein [Candidatus Zophobacter franzmannii]
MLPRELKKGIYWVGVIDWDLRNFHGYLTQRGSTYNAYLIIDEKITLIDNVKEKLYPEMIERISKIVDPSKIDIIVQNHVEGDHSGSLPALLERVPNAQIYATGNADKALKLLYHRDFNVKIVNGGDSISLGKRTLHFVPTPMIHWPDNMVTYCPEDKMLFSNDSFGQHIASSQRIDSEYPLSTIMEEARKYFANIVLPFRKMVVKALEVVKSLDIDMICPSHGLIWEKYIPEILEEYHMLSHNEANDKYALIVYDTMWESTRKMAYAIQRAFNHAGIDVRMVNLQNDHISDIMTEVATAKYICVGSSTLNNGILPSVAAFLTYLKGLSPQDRIGLAFGSYGWGGQSVGIVENYLKDCGFTIMDKIRHQYIPSKVDLDAITERVSAKIEEFKEEK